MDTEQSQPQRSTSILPLLAAAAFSLAILSPLFLHHAKRVEFDASLEVFFGADQRSRGSFEKLEEMMTQSVACMVLARFEGIFSNEGAQLVHELGESLLELEGVPRVFSLTRAERPVRAPGFSLDPSELVRFEPFLPRDGRSSEEWQAIAAKVTDYPWAKDLLVSEDGEWTMLVAEIERPLPDHAARAALREDVEAAVGPFRARVSELHVGGFPFIEREVRDEVVGDVTRFFVALPALLAIVLLITFRSLQILAAVLCFETMGIGFLPVLVNLNGGSINLYTGILFPLVAGLQLTFLTHFFAALKWGLSRGHDFPAALRGALEHVIKPSLIAALTTVIGLLSLLACDVELVREFGHLGAQAVIACYVVTFLPGWLLSRALAPAARSAAAAASPAVPASIPVSSLARFDRHRSHWLGIGLILVLSALPGWSGIRTDLRAIEFLSPQSEARQTVEAIDREMGGMNLFELEIDFGQPGAIQKLESLRYLERLERQALAIPEVTNVYGYAQIYAMLNEVWERESEGSRRVPDSPAAIALMGGIVHGQEFVFDESIYDDERRKTTLFLRTRDMPAERYLALLSDFVDFAEAEAPPGASVDGKSGLHSILESDRRIVRSQVRSLALCAAVVFLTLALLWRSLRMALCAILVNTPPLAAVLALHGYAAIPLNSVTVMVGAVVLGIAVDNSIHVLAFWREEGGSSGSADLLWSVLRRKLGAMLCTTAVLVGGLGLFLLSSFPPRGRLRRSGDPVAVRGPGLDGLSAPPPGRGALRLEERRGQPRGRRRLRSRLIARPRGF